jgi:beta-lactamase regulating signal transducer with metallopeptidase domain
MRDFVLDSLAKATLLLVAAGLVTLAWRRAAAQRHLVWTLALAGTLLLPAARVLGPAWRLPLLPARATPAVTTVSAPLARVAETAPSTPATPMASPAPIGAAPVSATLREPSRPASALWLLSFWAGGAILVFAAYLAGAWRVARIARRSRAIRSADWVELQASIAAELRLRTPVRLLAASGPAMPMTWGLRHPVILLPADADQWPEARRRDVLVHEMAHVERRDCLTQLLAVCACAFYWFHPLVWIAAARLRVERERACDDRVLSAGATPSDYASHLLEIARSLRAVPATGLASVAMARPSQLGSRLLDVLDPARRREALNRRLAVPAALSAALVVLPLAALRPTRLAAHQAPPAAMLRASDDPQETLEAAHRAIALEPVRRATPDTVDCQSRSSHSTASSSSDDRNGRHLMLRYQSGRCAIELEAEGKFRFNADYTDLSAIDAGGSVVVKRREGDHERRVEMRPGPEGVAHRSFVDDTERPYDADARAWLAATLTDLLRRTGYAGEARSRWILETRGQDALLEEITRISGDYARRIYYQTLVAEGRLDAATVARVVNDAGREISSDYDLAELLVLVATRYPLSEPARTAFVTAADHIESDYDRHRVLAVVLAGKSLPDELATAVLGAAGHIDSDYDLAEVLIVLIQKHPVTAAMSPAFFQAVGGIESAYDRRRVLATLLAQHETPPALVAAALASADQISSDYDRAELLVQVAEGPGVDEQSRDPFFTTLAGIDSDYDHARVLTALTEHPGLAEPVAAAIIASARDIGSAYDCANVLVAVAQHLRLTAALREAYVAAANRIGSEYDRTRALAALAGSTQLD